MIISVNCFFSQMSLDCLFWWSGSLASSSRPRSTRASRSSRENPPTTSSAGASSSRTARGQRFHDSIPDCRFDEFNLLEWLILLLLLSTPVLLLSFIKRKCHSCGFWLVYFVSREWCSLNLDVGLKNCLSLRPLLPCTVRFPTPLAFVNLAFVNLLALFFLSLYPRRYPGESTNPQFQFRRPRAPSLTPRLFIGQLPPGRLISFANGWPADLDYEALLRLGDIMGDVVPQGLSQTQINRLPTHIYDVSKFEEIAGTHREFSGM